MKTVMIVVSISVVAAARLAERRAAFTEAVALEVRVACLAVFLCS